MKLKTCKNIEVRYEKEKTSSYDFSIWIGDNYEHPFTTNYPTYEEAVEAAIKYSLENLI